MHIEKGLSLGYFQDIFLNVILSCTLCYQADRWTLDTCLPIVLYLLSLTYYW